MPGRWSVRPGAQRAKEPVHGQAATTVLWNDAVQRDFEKEYLEVLDSQTWATVREIGRLGQLNSEARRHVR